MNNILSFNEYSGQELERVAYDNMLNEKSSLNSGIRGFFNKRASRQVKSELAEEIEMSKTIMEGIQKGLETLNENFDIIKKNIEEGENDSKKGEKQKALDDIIKILETSRKNTWDINELIDEGEIDYTGFTANVGIASIAYFGILLTPFRAAVMIHKGYNYFFNIVKNTIRKSLVMLQLNFDQFENLIITKGFQSADWVHAVDTNEKITEFYMQLETELVGKGGIIKGKQADKIKNKLQLARDKAKQIREGDKIAQQNENALNCLNEYNNTYTRSLEALKQYSQEDVQKHLDAIKTSMTKIAGQEADLQTYAELIIAAAEEHAYKVSSSIYNKFAKMTEVFSLPNQQKLIDLIQEANKEQLASIKKERKEKKAADELQKKLENDNQVEHDGLEVFNKLDSVKIGKMDDETKKYNSSEIEASGWTYKEYEDLNEDDQNSLETWLLAHPEVLAKCGMTLQVAVGGAQNTMIQDYCDSLIDYVSPCISEEKNESYILNFDEYFLNEALGDTDDDGFFKKDDDEKKEEKDDKKDDEGKEEKKAEKKEKKVVEPGTIEFRGFNRVKDLWDDMSKDRDIYTDDFIDELDETIEDLTAKMSETTRNKKEALTLWKEFLKAKKERIEKKMKGSSDDKSDKKKKYYLDFDNLSDSNRKDLRILYGDDKVAKVALKVIGKSILKDNTFVKNVSDIVNLINDSLNERKEIKSTVLYNLLSESIKVLKDKRAHDYYDAEEESKDSAKKSEK